MRVPAWVIENNFITWYGGGPSAFRFNSKFAPSISPFHETGLEMFAFYVLERVAQASRNDASSSSSSIWVYQ